MVWISAVSYPFFSFSSLLFVLVFSDFDKIPTSLDNSQPQAGRMMRVMAGKGKMANMQGMGNVGGMGDYLLVSFFFI